MDEVKLLPCQCPFCKREGAWAEVEDDGYARVGCTCTALGPLRKGEQAAIEAWNAATRPPIGTDEVVERVGRAISTAANDEISSVTCEIYAHAAIAAMPTIDQDGGEA